MTRLGRGDRKRPGDGCTSAHDEERALEVRQRGGALVAPTAKELDESERYLDHFRRIYLSAQKGGTHPLIPTVGVTSAQTMEGRTTVALGIAAAMAADLDRPVILVEMDLAHPGLCRLLRLPEEPGVSEYLRHEAGLGEVVRQLTRNLFVLPAGNARGDAARLVRQLVAADLRSRLSNNNAMLVFDLPPVLASSYGTLASSVAESLIFVIRAGFSKGEDVRAALQRLDESAVHAVALNGAEPPLPAWLRSLVK